MKFLCVCQGGMIRSVAMKYAFWGTGHDALSVGYDAVSKDTLGMLCEWADIILLAELTMSVFIPVSGVDHKIIDCEIGPDKWGSQGLHEAVIEIAPKVRELEIFKEPMSA